jgi:Aspartate carbamoyltransferase, catalytic chain
VKKVPLLRGKSVFNLFFENSTRTRTTFEIAAKRLSADVHQPRHRALVDGQGREPARHDRQPVGDARRHVRRAPQRIGRAVPDRAPLRAARARGQRRRRPPRAPDAGLLDMYTIRHYKKSFTITVAIVGDIVHSRVARSDIHALTTLGVPEIRAVGPKTLVPGDLREMGVRVCHDMAEGVRDADVIIMLRLQNERMSGAMLPERRRVLQELRPSPPEKLALAKPDAIVMHPGPINRGVEIDSEVADGTQSVILPQVTFGIAVRMAVMSIIAGNVA